ncbi:MAG: hypothetical protein LBO72_00220, partial [Helicobacteraceae bacterium]|nr:hypothetical protein [Helicobacteraceae bacterium]
LRLKRFIADCSLDNFCASSDVYKHYYSIYQSLPDENKTALDQMAVDLARNEQEAKPCGLFASIKKLFTCG